MKDLKISEVAFTTARGAKVEVKLIKNAKLGVNGYLPSTMHMIEVYVTGDQYTFYAATDDQEHGYSLKVNMGKATIPVPADSQQVIRSLIEEMETNNQAAIEQASLEEAEYQVHAAKINRAMNG